MTTQPEAARVERGPITKVERFTLGMAALLERQGFTVAANELRRLYAECEHHKAWAAHITAENKSLEAQRDALLEALKTVEWHGQGSCWVVDADKIAAAIKAAEENT